MPTTGMIFNQTFKCQKCQKNFRDIWLPTNVCCRIAARESSVKQPPFSRYAASGEHVYGTRTRTEETRSRDRTSGTSTTCDDMLPTRGLKSFRNKLAPFSTLGKPTCGFNFSRSTDNKKKKFGIMPSNLVKWRSQRTEKVAPVTQA